MIEESIDQVVANLKKQVRGHGVHRKKILEKVIKILDEIKLNPNDEAPRSIEVKVGLFKLAEDLMSSSEAAENRIVAAELRKLSVDVEKDNSERIANALIQIGHLPQIRSDDTEMPDDGELDRIFTERNLSISDAEVDMSGPATPLVKKDKKKD